MVEVTPTYSMNPADYEYDPNVYHLRHIPGVGLYTFDNNVKLAKTLQGLIKKLLTGLCQTLPT